MTNKKIVYVDGFKIRMNLDLEFAICHEQNLDFNSYAPKFYIPSDEVWIDARFKDEQELLLRIETEEVAGATADERRETRKKLFLDKGQLPEFKVESEIENGISVVKVRGELIRKFIDPDFMQGGHEFVYDYVPKGEVWLDFKNDPAELPFILHHEIVERNLMEKGESYDSGHDAAIAAEKKMRRGAGACYPGDGKYTSKNLSEYYV